MAGRKGVTPEERFWEKVETGEPDECWEWTASRGSQTGYGHMWWIGRYEYSHRISWLIHNGEIPDDMHVLHYCDNPICVNPDHLWIGEHSDNMKDRDNKGRGYFSRKKDFLRGEDVHNSVLTEIEVRKIRKLYSDGNWSHRRLANKFDVSSTTIGAVTRYETWKHI